MSNYTLQINNASRGDGSVAIYQKLPELSTESIEVFTLAWIARQVPRGRSITFTWRLAYSFVLSLYQDRTPLGAPIASQSMRADPASGPNWVRLEYHEEDDRYVFGERGFEPRSRTSLIVETGARQGRAPRAMKSEVVAAGIGMHGHGTHLVEVQPNMRVTFTPRPTYHVVFGEYESGQAVDVPDVARVAHEIDFKNTFERELTWDGDHWRSIR